MILFAAQWDEDPANVYTSIILVMRSISWKFIGEWIIPPENKIFYQEKQKTQSLCFQRGYLLANT